MESYDGVAQWIERQFAELNVAGSSPVTVAFVFGFHKGSYMYLWDHPYSTSFLFPFSAFLSPLSSSLFDYLNWLRSATLALGVQTKGTSLLSKDGESIGCPDEFLGEAWVIGGMASVVNNHQLGTWPHTFEFPGVCNGGLKVKATIHQDPGYTG